MTWVYVFIDWATGQEAGRLEFSSKLQTAAG
jgi:hypothetical protein